MLKTRRMGFRSYLTAWCALGLTICAGTMLNGASPDTGGAELAGARVTSGGASTASSHFAIEGTIDTAGSFVTRHRSNNFELTSVTAMQDESNRTAVDGSWMHY